MDTRICEAIRTMTLLQFEYDGLPRVVAPHAHGISTADNEVMRGYQTDGESSSYPLGWRLWIVEKMVGVKDTEVTFPAAFPDYAEDDSAMAPVHCHL